MSGVIKLQYFTYELWMANPSEEIDKLWRENDLAYSRKLESLKDRLSRKAFHFLCEVGFHDYRVKNIEIIHNEYGKKNPVTVILHVTNNFKTWQIVYKDVQKVVINYESSTFGRGFDDWGYDELLDVDENTLSHEILFASGSTLLVHIPNKKMFVSRLKETTEG